MVAYRRHDSGFNDNHGGEEMSVNSKRLRSSIPSFNNTTVYSDVFDLTNHKAYGLQVVLAGSSIEGNVSLEQSNNGVNWAAVASATNFTAAGSLFFAGDFNHMFLRVKLVSTDTDAVVGEIYGIGKES
jgi:hypothetical protein